MLTYAVQNHVIPSCLADSDMLCDLTDQLKVQSALRQITSSGGTLYVRLSNEQILSISNVEPIQSELILDHELNDTESDHSVKPLLGELGIAAKDNDGPNATLGQAGAGVKEDATEISPETYDSSHCLLVRNFTKLSKEALLYILDYRNSEAVRQHMLNTNPIAADDHLKFCAGLKDRTDRMCLISCLDLKPTSVASLNFDATGEIIVDYGMYALGTAHPERNAREQGRIPVYAIDKLVISHMALTQGIKQVNFQFKKSNPKSFHVNISKHHTTVSHEDSECFYTKLECTGSVEFYLKQIAEFCCTNNCKVAFDI